MISREFKSEFKINEEGANKMEKWKIPFAMFVLFAVSLLASPKVFSYSPDVITEPGDTVITLDTIRNELSSDGEWIKVNPSEVDSESVTDGSADFDDDVNTEFVWRPYNVDENWSPYTNGYWTYTNCGWMWVSYYQWGWRTYHYGRWWWSPRWGWVWSPGYIWAPSWVVWMYWGDYCGWYPLSPRARWHHHHHRYYSHHIRYRVRHWTFCHNYYFNGTTIDPNIIVDPSENPNILKYAKFSSEIKYENGVVKSDGPELSIIEKSIGKKIPAEDVTRYNTTKKVNEYVKRSEKEEYAVEKQTYQKRQEVKTNNDKQVKKEEKKMEETWESTPYSGTPKGNNENRSGEKNKDVEKKRDDGYREKNKNEGSNENKQSEPPKYEKKNDSPPRNDSPRNETPRNESPKKNDNPQKNNETKSDDGNNQKDSKR